MPHEVCFAIIRSPCVPVVTRIATDSGLNIQVSTVIPGIFQKRAEGDDRSSRAVLLGDLSDLFRYFAVGNVRVKMSQPSGGR